MSANGRFPQEWKSTTLGEVCHVIQGQSPPGKTYNTEGMGLPFLQGKAEFGALYPESL
jgi:type I restriction enzyme S subunit